MLTMVKWKFITVDNLFIPLFIFQTTFYVLNNTVSAVCCLIPTCPNNPIKYITKESIQDQKLYFHSCENNNVIPILFQWPPTFFSFRINGTQAHDISISWYNKKAIKMHDRTKSQNNRKLRMKKWNLIRYVHCWT